VQGQVVQAQVEGNFSKTLEASDVAARHEASEDGQASVYERNPSHTEEIYGGEKMVENELQVDEDEQVVMLGRVAVDSGQLLMVDPCYIVDEWDDTPTETTLGDMTLTMEASLGECVTVANPQTHPQGGGSVMDGLAVVTRSGIGDGYYPVYAVLGEILPGWGARVRRIIIDFEDHPLLADDSAESADGLECSCRPTDGAELGGAPSA
jgi:hypothetical protein